MTASISVPGQKRAICVYCGSSMGSDPIYEASAGRLGSAMVAAGFDLVYGGGGTGMMGEVARSVLAAGGQVTGIIPDFLKAREAHLKTVSELIVTDDMHQRKMLMFQRADAFVAMPGGIGTLEELIEQMTWAQLGRHTKPIIIADIAGFWSPLLSLLDHMQDAAFLRLPKPDADRPALFHVVSEVAEIVPRIEGLLAAARQPGPEDEITGRF